MNIPSKNHLWHSLYGTICLGLSVVFAIVGLIFLFAPDSVINFFNSISRQIGLPEALLNGFGLYQVLAVSYMYVVTLLAYFIYKNPDSDYLPLLLIQGKSASSVSSFALFFVHQPYLILLTNGIVDGFIAFGIFFLYKKSRAIQK